MLKNIKGGTTSVRYYFEETKQVFFLNNSAMLLPFEFTHKALKHLLLMILLFNF